MTVPGRSFLARAGVDFWVVCFASGRGALAGLSPDPQPASAAAATIASATDRCMALPSPGGLLCYALPETRECNAYAYSDSPAASRASRQLANARISRNV